MSDKELEEYIKKVDANFNSHIEKGTIEMSNEYYNLLEERMARLINENQELKEQLETKHKGFMASVEESCELAKEVDLWNKKYNEEVDKLRELRNWLEFRWEQSQDVWFVKIINKLNELEGGRNV